jgi:GT2 family glycosyltransferase
MIQDRFGQVKLIPVFVNSGFSRANNLGYNQSEGKYLLFLNSDTIVHHNTLDKIVRYLDQHPDAGVLGPKILDPESNPTASFQRFLDVKKLFLGSERLRYFVDIDRYRMNYPLYDFAATQDVEWVSGACLATRRDIFEQVGRWDEHYFLYYEDMDLCLQVLRAGFRVVFYPDAEITHLFGRSSKKVKQDLRDIQKRSMRYYFSKNYPLVHYWIACLFTFITFR